ncbi:helix-turn-helix domain-containing protein [Chryseobacterium jejuense]|uniref:helix-turn-helix domain-containing protein n=1 Tax=Chryseobacterium jejuense TaxID=445960 RepID=UPI001AE940BE|nr:helix-turn-helix transcriptional regulator [Chryseobacterium jejuense]MBP2619534.1 transcriptional regulator with XRE-family HTH domain [Chryseobacterium jejuense]
MDDKYLKAYKHVGMRIKEKRIELKLTQEQLSNRIPKMDRSKISDIENGKEDYLFSTLLKVCDALKTTLPDLLNEK